MEVYHGIGVLDATAVGKAKVFRQNVSVGRKRSNWGPGKELERLRKGIGDLSDELQALHQRETGECAEIFEIHQMMIEDDDFCRAMEERIIFQGMDAVSAAEWAGKEFAARFRQMESEYMRARAADVEQITAALIACLTDGDRENLFAVPSLEEDVILFAHDLSPAQTVLLDRSHLLAIVTAGGSILSHTAILAKSMGIPAIIGVGEGCLQMVREGEEVVVDGESGRVILSPDEPTVEDAERKLQARLGEIDRLSVLKEMDAVTLDGTRVELFANIGSLRELETVHHAGAEGIGLFRSEFLYLERDSFPDEEDQLAVYRQIVEGMDGKRVIIRTLDIGADKKTDYFGLSAEENPAMGLRAIRLCLSRPDVFRTQLRALFRASVYGKLSILFPMVTTEWECREILSICDKVKEELSQEGIGYSEDVLLGVMIETPAAALISHRLAELVDFFSIGTNDLAQYTLACDRQNPTISRWFDPCHEAVLRLISMTVENARQQGVWVGICGELAADLSLTEAFLRMGVDELSVSPACLLRLKERVREIDLRG